jgi:O-antigen/teichoic acid export membrane protein
MDLFRDSTRTLIFKMLIFVIGIFTSTIVARGLGPEGRGILTIVFMLPALIASVGSWGLGSANIYLLGHGAYGRDQFSGNTVILTLVLSTVYFAVLLFFFGDLQRLVFRDAPARLVLLGFILLPLTIFINLAGNGILRGIQKIKEFNVAALIQRVTYFLFVAALFAFQRLEILGVIAATICGALVACVYILVILRRSTGISRRFNFPLFRESLRYGLREHVGNIAQRFNLRFDTVLLAALLAPADIGYYSIAVLLAELIWYIPDSIGVVLFPRVASSGRERAAETTMQIHRITFLLTVVLCAVLGLAGHRVIHLLYGAEFLPAYLPLIFLLPGIVGLSAAKILTKFTSGIGKPQYNSFAAICSFTVNIPLLLVLVPRMGILGASVASSTAYILDLIVMVILFRRETGCGLRQLFIINGRDIQQIRSRLGKTSGDTAAK